MSSSPGPRRPGSATGPAEVLAELRRSALLGADALLQHVPDTGDHATGRAVDTFVEQAVDALRALAETVGETLAGAAGDGPGEMDSHPTHDPTGPPGGAEPAPPRWRW